MKARALELQGIILFEPQVFSDERGFFFESFHEARYRDAGLSATFVQDNHVWSVARALRGLHFQAKRPQGKLVRALRGAIFDVGVDIRVGSPTFGRWVGEVLSETNRRQLYIPEGFAHGYCVVDAPAEVAYKCTDVYDPTDQCGILWNDPAVGVEWPISDPVLSEKDQALGGLTLARRDLPQL